MSFLGNLWDNFTNTVKDPIGGIEKTFSDPGASPFGVLVDPVGVGTGTPSYDNPYMQALGLAAATYGLGSAAGAGAGAADAGAGAGAGAAGAGAEAGAGAASIGAADAGAAGALGTGTFDSLGSLGVDSFATQGYLDPLATVGQGGALAATVPEATGAMGAGMGGAATNAAGEMIGNGAAAAGGVAPAAAPAAAPSASQPSWLNRALSAGKSALPYASLAANLSSANKQPNYAAALNKSANTTGNVGSQLLSNFQAGQLSGADQQQIAQYGQQQTAAVNEYYAKAGLSNSSMHTQALQQVQQQSETMRQQALQKMLSQGLAATGTTNSALSAAANAGLASSKDTSAALQDFMKALSMMNAPVTSGQ